MSPSRSTRLRCETLSGPVALHLRARSALQALWCAQGRAALLTTLSAKGVRIASSCFTPRARDPSLHRPRCHSHSRLEFLLAASLPRGSGTSPRRRRRITHQPEEVPYGGFGPCRAILQSRTGHRGLKSMTATLLQLGALSFCVFFQ